MSKSAIVAAAAVVTFVVVVFVIQASRGLNERAQQQKPAVLLKDEPNTNKPSGFWSYRKGKARGGAYQYGKLALGVGIAGTAGIVMFTLARRAQATRQS